MKHTAESDHTVSLKEEAGYFYKKIFSANPSPAIVASYVKANQSLMKNGHGKVQFLVARRADIEAVEIAWRRLIPDNPLTRKIHILIYLAESTPENFPRFYSFKSRCITTWSLPVIQACRTIYKLIKGKILLKRFKLV
jgi:hypothetical protein